MKIPKKISVLGVPYKIVQKDRLEGENGELSNCHMGWSDEASHKIELATSDIFCDEIKEQTFFHELVHAIMYESGIARKVDNGDHEIYAQCFGNAFHQIFKQML